MATTLLTLAVAPIPGGTFISSIFTCPASFSVLTITFAVSAPDNTNTGKSMTLLLEKELVFNSGNFVSDAGFTWSGNTNGGSPVVNIGAGPLPGLRCRLVMTNPSTVTTSITVTAQ